MDDGVNEDVANVLPSFVSPLWVCYTPPSGARQGRLYYARFRPIGRALAGEPAPEAEA